MRTLAIPAAAALAAVLCTAPPAAGEEGDRLRRAIEAISATTLTPGREHHVGIVAEARRGGAVVRFASGDGDLATGDARTPRRDLDDRFRVASVTKLMTATFILQLAQEGRFDPAAPAGVAQLDTPLDRTPLRGVLSGLRDWLGRSPGYREDRITIAHLLRHTGGVRNWTDDVWTRTTVLGGPAALLPANRYRTWETRHLLKAIEDDRPGELGVHHYSNTGYSLLGLLIDRVAGPYQREIERRVIAPLGLTGTSLPTAAPVRNGLPAPHSRHFASLLSATATGTPFGVHDYTELNPTALGSAGEAISTVGDLNTFLRALLGGRLLSPPLLRAMTETVPVGASGAGHGLGPQSRVLDCAGGRSITLHGHGGTWHGSLTWVYADPTGDHSVAFNLNMDWAGTAAAFDRVLRAEFSCPA